MSTGTGTWLLAASTLGCPGEPLDVVLGWAGRTCARALELRAAPGEVVDVGSSPTERRAVRRAVHEAGVEVLAVASYVRVAAEGPDAAVVADLRAHLELAADLGARFVRVFPSAPTERAARDERPRLREDVAVVDARAARRLAAASPLAAGLGVRLALETHDSHPRGEDVLRVLSRLDEALPGHGTAVVWDVLHPWRTGEDVATTWRLLGPLLTTGRGWVQVKDVAARASATPLLPGQGALPLDDVLGLLRAGGYRGPLCLEWERAWHPEIPRLDDALAATAAWLAERG